MKMSEKQVKMVEDAILENGIDTSDHCISRRDLSNGKHIFNSLKDETGPVYEIFGSNGCGYITYGLYKSAVGKIYVLTVNTKILKGELVVNFTSIIEVDNDRWFD